MSEKPKRIQRKRTKGWRMPEGAVYVGRPSKWGSPFTVVNAHRQGWIIYDDSNGVENSGGFLSAWPTRLAAQTEAVRLFRKHIEKRERFRMWSEIDGHDLACWCPLDQPCHADVLLELANA